MPSVVAILEDNPERRDAMRAALSTLLPEVEIAFFENANHMIDWLGINLGDVILISLDHDLPISDDRDNPIDFGTGQQVADYLCSVAPTCPVIVHTSNSQFGPGMIIALKKSGWPLSRVYPSDDVVWIQESWARQVRDYIRSGWISRRPDQ